MARYRFFKENEIRDKKNEKVLVVYHQDYMLQMTMQKITTLIKQNLPQEDMFL